MENAQVLECAQSKSSKNNQTKPGWLLLLWWIVASLAASGLVVRFFASLYSGVTFDELDFARLANNLLLGMLLGTAIGVAQWLVISRYLTRAIWWIVASGFGWAAGMGVFHLLQTFFVIRLDPEQWKVIDSVFTTLKLIEEAEDSYLTYYVEAGFLWGIIALIQLVTIRRDILRSDWWKWIFVGVLAGFVFFRMSNAGSHLPLTGIAQIVANTILPIGAASGIMGAMLIYLLRRKTRKE